MPAVLLCDTLIFTDQVMAAPPEKREELLADLQKFAFMGIPDIRQTGQVTLPA